MSDIDICFIDQASDVRQKDGQSPPGPENSMPCEPGENDLLVMPEDDRQNEGTFSTATVDSEQDSSSPGPALPALEWNDSHSKTSVPPTAEMPLSSYFGDLADLVDLRSLFDAVSTMPQAFTRPVDYYQTCKIVSHSKKWRVATEMLIFPIDSAKRYINDMDISHSHSPIEQPRQSRTGSMRDHGHTHLGRL